MQSVDFLECQMTKVGNMSIDKIMELKNQLTNKMQVYKLNKI